VVRAAVALELHLLLHQCDVFPRPHRSVGQRRRLYGQTKVGGVPAADATAATAWYEDGTTAAPVVTLLLLLLLMMLLLLLLLLVVVVLRWRHQLPVLELWAVVTRSLLLLKWPGKCKR
jgi:hypothetical protein